MRVSPRRSRPIISSSTIFWGCRFQGGRTQSPMHLERANAELLLQARYPSLKRMSEGLPTLREAYERAKFYRLEPTRLVLIDNSRGFGHKDTLELGGNATEAMF